MRATPSSLAQLFVLACILFSAAATPSRAAEPAHEEIDPDVLRKVRKLIQGTLSTEEADREKAWNQIKDMGNLAVPGLIGLYRQKTTTAEEVGSILIALGDSKDPRAGPALVELLGSPEPSVRRDTARAIGDINYKDGAPALLKIARDEKENEDVRLFTATAAAKLGSDDAFAVLTALLKSQHPEVRSRAVFAIGKFGGVKHVGQIEVALADSDDSVREDAVEALHLLKKEETYPGLIKATADENYKIRNAAMDALRDGTGEKIENNPQAWKDWWTAQAEKKNKKNEKKDDTKLKIKKGAPEDDAAPPKGPKGKED